MIAKLDGWTNESGDRDTIWSYQSVFKELMNPSLADLQMLINILDGHIHTSLILEGSGRHWLAVGGGEGGCYIVNGQLYSGEFFELVKNNPTAGNISLNVGGQTGLYPSDRACSKAEALQAAAFFLREGRLDPALSWETS